jgi:hypothetical protein
VRTSASLLGQSTTVGKCRMRRASSSSRNTVTAVRVAVLSRGGVGSLMAEAVQIEAPVGREGPGDAAFAAPGRADQGEQERDIGQGERASTDSPCECTQSSRRGVGYARRPGGRGRLPIARRIRGGCDPSSRGPSGSGRSSAPSRSGMDRDGTGSRQQREALLLVGMWPRSRSTRMAVRAVCPASRSRRCAPAATGLR